MGNYALIFAGGTGTRMKSSDIPKQFLKIHGKPIIIHTIEKFEHSNKIDGILIVCIESWIKNMKEFIKDFNIHKVIDVISGGDSGQSSIYKGLEYLSKKFDMNSTVLIHDGVRPLIDNETINKNIEYTNLYGNCITVVKATETILVTSEHEINALDRNRCLIARAPQTFILKDIYWAHRESLNANLKFIDSAMMMLHFGYKLNTIEGPVSNIKITTPLDYYMFKGILDLKENSQISYDI